MSDGLWNARGSGANASGVESIRQASLSRHKLLTVCLSTVGTKGPLDSSSYASVNPNTILSNTNNEGGPHFILSPETPCGTKTVGFEWTLFASGLFSVETAATPGVGGFTVTIWELIANTQIGDISFMPIWASFEPKTTVGLQELYHSFDVNASAIRFQVENAVDLESSLTIALCEL